MSFQRIFRRRREWRKGDFKQIMANQQTLSQIKTVDKGFIKTLNDETREGRHIYTVIHIIITAALP